MGSLFIPSKLLTRDNASLIITYMGTVGTNPSNQRLLSEILDITLVGEDGNLVTKLSPQLTICFPRPNVTRKSERVCLSFFNERKAKWECEDECLTTTDNAGDTVCGQTDHLTNFALLLMGGSSQKDQDPCQSVSQNETLSWISLGMVIGAILIVAVGVVAVEVRTRVERTRLEGVLHRAGVASTTPTV